MMNKCLCEKNRESLHYEAQKMEGNKQKVHLAAVRPARFQLVQRFGPTLQNSKKKISYYVKLLRERSCKFIAIYCDRLKEKIETIITLLADFSARLAARSLNFGKCRKFGTTFLKGEPQLTYTF